ncbi:unnamed protein product, partial [Thlaspi arvense]
EHSNWYWEELSLKRAIIDKNARIGDNVKIVNTDNFKKQLGKQMDTSSRVGSWTVIRML